MLKPATRTARAGIVAPQLFGQFFVAVDDAASAFDLCFRREAFAALAHRFVEKIVRRSRIALP
jgi:hypothetical protein